MTNDQLSAIIEKIALEIVLLDTSDTDKMVELDSLFSNISQWAESNSQNLLYETATNCSDILKKVIDKTNPLQEEALEIISYAITEIQSHARNELDFSLMSLPPEIATHKPPGTDNGNKKSENNGLRHPGALPSHLDSSLFAEFLSIQVNNMDKIESLVLSIEENNDEPSITELKRMIHTAKGEAGFLNLNDVENVLHLTEDILSLDLPSQYSDLFLYTVDWMRKTFAWYKGGTLQPEPASGLLKMLQTQNIKTPQDNNIDFQELKSSGVEETIIHQLVENKSLLPENNTLYKKFISKIDKSIGSSEKLFSKLTKQIKKIERNDSQPAPEIQKTILKLQYYITKISAVADFIGLNEIQLLTRYTHDLIDRMLTDTRFCKTDIVSLIETSFNALTEQTRALETALADQSPIRFDENLPNHLARLQVITEKKTNEKIKEKNDVPTVVADAPIPSLTQPLDTIPAEDTSQSISTSSITQIKESVNVDAERLDKIIDMIGELVIAESMVLQAEEIKQIDSQELSRHLNHMDKITRGLQETGLSLRMLPIKSTFQKMARVARDTAKKSGKDVKFIMQGEETELDKTLVDKIGDPLLHMVRNAIDHGIETSEEERLKKNKPPKGTVTIKAYHKGGNIHIEIEDDGKGLDTDKILEKAVARDIIHNGEIRNEKEIFDLIFEPGFSTASEITDLSGRGVGMNVVKSSIDSLHGKIDIHSEKDRGSRFTIRIPLTLAIIDGMVVRVEGERYIIPTLSIITSGELNKKSITSVFNKGDMVDVQGNLVPLFRLSNLLEKYSVTELPEKSLMVVVEEGGKQAAIVIDELLGKQQIVIKTLGESMKNIPGISGGAIMPDGRVGLIIDVGSLVKSAHSNSRKPDKKLPNH